MNDNFLLETEEARHLFFDYAEKLPIIDYHCHLSPTEIESDRRFANLTQVWLAGDHYKWRAMRTTGVGEHFITGPASDSEKFEKWAETVPKTLRNPLYHWTHLELRRPFGISDRVLNPTTAPSIWAECNEQLAQPGFSTRGLLTQMNVEVVCTTDDPTDDLAAHRALRKSRFATRVFPTFRPDRAMDVRSPEAFAAYVRRLSEVTGAAIRDFDGFLSALAERHTYFHEHGCRLSDHGLETVDASDPSAAEVNEAFSLLLAERPLSPKLAQGFRSQVLFEIGRLNHARGWTQQLHLGALRNNNTRMMRSLGPDTGFDSIGDFEIARPLAHYLDRLDNLDQLPRTILYNLNPRDNELLATMLGNFQDGSIPGKLQYGSAWWFLDQQDGMTAQLSALSNMGILSQFVGMLTDSRSFLSFPRHEYFRRLLCNILGGEMARGLLPADLDLLGQMVSDISYGNARRYFGFSEH